MSMIEKNNAIEVSDLAGISKPIEKLIDSVSNATGVIFEPHRIKRKAKAEAEALVILAKADAHKSEIELRMQERVINREIRRQKNIESITQKAAEALSNEEEVSNKPVHEDWMFRFFEESQDTSDEEIQTLWGKILANEVKSPKSFSYRTLKVLKELTKEEAELFTNLCDYVFDFSTDGKSKKQPIILEIESYKMKEKGLDFEALQHLEAIGLIKFNNVSNYIFENVKKGVFSYKDVRYFITREDFTNLSIGKVMFTSVGEELCPITSSSSDDIIKDNIFRLWEKEGWNIEPLTTRLKP